MEEEIIKPIGKIENGMKYWVSFVTHPEVEPTNARKCSKQWRSKHVKTFKVTGKLDEGG